MAAEDMPRLWRKIHLTKNDIDLRTLLTCGQSFTWKESGKDVWSNVLNNTIFSLRQSESQLMWCTPLRDWQTKTGTPTQLLKQKALHVSQTEKSISLLPTTLLKRKKIKSETTTTISVNAPEWEQDIKPAELAKEAFQEESEVECGSELVTKTTFTDEQAESMLRDYFQLHVDLPNLYKQWSRADKHFANISSVFPGIRIMRQDPTENLFSFICSSNNHVSRISGMVNKLSEHYGTKIGRLGDCDFYSFPTADKLDNPNVESKLRDLGFGYRAKYISRTARIIHAERPDGWLESLRALPYEDCIMELTKLQGVGRKVADCVTLMSLDKPHVVPVDTHVLQIAVRDYQVPGLTKGTKSLTPALHDRIGKYFVNLYGEYAGWAHTVLFAADLKRFSNHSPVKSAKRPIKEEKTTSKRPIKEEKTTSKRRITAPQNERIIPETKTSEEQQVTTTGVKRTRNKTKD